MQDTMLFAQEMNDRIFSKTMKTGNDFSRY
jgi:hypothetical protein